MYTSYQIANYFICKSQDTGVELTPMKLIKLCYIAHGWHLGLYDNQLLDEVIYAWKFGPVVNSIYHEFKKYRSHQITELYTDGTHYPVPDKSIFPFLEEVWKSYSHFNGIELSAMTHQAGTPWDTVWQKNKGDKFTIIPNDIIKTHYKEKIQQTNARLTQSDSTFK